MSTISVKYNKVVNSYVLRVNGLSKGIFPKKDNEKIGNTMSEHLSGYQQMFINGAVEYSEKTGIKDIERRKNGITFIFKL